MTFIRCSSIQGRELVSYQLHVYYIVLCLCSQEEIAKLLRFESSRLEPGQKTSLDEYASRMQAGERTIYYFSAPRCQDIITSPSPHPTMLQGRHLELLWFPVGMCILIPTLCA